MTLAACLHRQRFRNFLTVEIGLARVVSTFRWELSIHTGFDYSSKGGARRMAVTYSAPAIRSPSSNNPYLPIRHRNTAQLPEQHNWTRAWRTCTDLAGLDGRMYDSARAHFATFLPGDHGDVGPGRGEC
jgi:hypothetical protein